MPEDMTANVGDRVQQIKDYSVWPTRMMTPAGSVGRLGTINKVVPTSTALSHRAFETLFFHVVWDEKREADRVPWWAIRVLGPVDRIAELDNGPS